MNISNQALINFQSFIWSFYGEHKRSFPWRYAQDPYHVFVSEIMLQQTQTYRVQPKYEQFITTFPDFATLAGSSLRDVLSVWQGLGYNRRGKALHEAAQKVMQEFGGILPNDEMLLQEFPGIGKATAASICAFAFNKPTIFIETNIRAVFIHTFFKNRDDVHDKELWPIVAAALDQANPREWYYALMDYGVYLKKQMVNPSRKSKHHHAQTRFEGSDRQIRGNIIALLTHHEKLTWDQLLQQTQKEESRVARIAEQLCKEGMVQKTNGFFEIS